jgi:hypothetical protein
VLAVVSIAAIAGSGCGTLTTMAATVDGVDITNDDFEAVLGDLGAAGLPGVEIDEATGTMPGDTARAVLGLMVRDTATTTYLEDAGESITDADRDEFLANVSPDEQAQLDAMSEDTARLFVDNQAAPVALGRVSAPSEEELEQRYDELPVSTGAMCLRHILVATEAEARDVVEELEAGADFAELAAERSTDEGSAANGGALGADDQPCTGLEVARQSLDQQFFTGAFDAQAGVPTEPIESPFGWHVVLARPFEEIGPALVALHEANPGTLGLTGALATADVAVDPRYGYWDAVSSSVVGLG